MILVRSRLAASLILLALVAPARSQSSSQPQRNPRIGQMLELLGKTRTPSEAAISPDGKTVAWSVRGSRGVEIHLTEIASGADKLLETASDQKCGGNMSPVWSPDGESLAYLSDCYPESKGQDEVFLWSKKTAQSKQLTHLTGELSDMAWSPDGKTIAFLFVENATRSAGALAAMKPWNGVYGEDGVEVQWVSVADVATGAVISVTPKNLHVYEFSWAPSSREIAFIGANPPGENNWWVAKLYIAQFDRA